MRSSLTLSLMQVIFLEELQTELYTMVGRVQEQLDRLESIDGRLVAAYKSEALIGGSDYVYLRDLGAF